MIQNIFSRLSRRESSILYISIAIIIAVFFDRAVIRPVVNKMNKLNREILIEEKELERAIYILSQEGLVTKEHKKITQYIKQSQSDEEETAELLSEIEKLASKSSVFLADIKPRPIEDAAPYKKYTVEIEIESEISYLVDFIYQLERSPRMLRVKDFSTAPKKKKSSTLKMRMTITQVLIAP